MTLEFPGAVPEIPVRDVDEATAYYENNLGFKVEWGGGELGLAGISKGSCRMGAWGTKDFYVEDPDGYIICFGGHPESG